MKIEERFAFLRATIEERIQEDGWPETVKETVDLIVEYLHPKAVAAIKAQSKDKMYRFHGGMWIRNTFGLWQDNHALLKDTGEEHPDDASGVILKALWERVNV